MQSDSPPENDEMELYTDELDPTFVNSRREAGIIFCAWLVALCWCVPFCYFPDIQTLKTKQVVLIVTKQACLPNSSNFYPIAFGRPATVPKCAYNRRCRSPESVLGFVGRCSPDGFQRCGGTVFPSWAVLCIQSQLQNAIKNKTERPPILKTPRSFLVYV